MNVAIGAPRPNAALAIRNAMRANRKWNTRPELALRKGLRQAGMTGYRVHWRKAPGTPDVAFVGKQVAVLAMGCFWHQCPRCRRSAPQRNAEWWQRKFAMNRARDERNRQALTASGWTVVELWECEITRRLDDCVDLVGKALRSDVRGLWGVKPGTTEAADATPRYVTHIL